MSAQKIQIFATTAFAGTLQGLMNVTAGLGSLEIIVTTSSTNASPFLVKTEEAATTLLTHTNVIVLQVLKV